MQKATFAAGCFWGVEEFFRTQKGVLSTLVGYTGGHTINPDYEDVCGTDTGHAEALEITFDPNLITYETLVQLFFKMHDSTTKNRQGPDVGSQYRSAIFYHSPEQKTIAEKVKQNMQKNMPKPIVTKITAASTFYPAEEYHQKYYKKRGIKGGH